VFAMAISTRQSKLFSSMRAPLTAALPFAEEHGRYQVNELCENASLFGVGGKILLLVPSLHSTLIFLKIFSITCIIHGWSHLGKSGGRILYKTSVPRIYC